MDAGLGETVMFLPSSDLGQTDTYYLFDDPDVTDTLIVAVDPNDPAVFLPGCEG